MQESLRTVAESMKTWQKIFPLFCAAGVQNLIAGVGPFAAIDPVYWTSPASLADLLDGLRNGPAAPGVCVMPDNRPC